MNQPNHPEHRPDPLRPKANSPKLEYPPFMSNPEPLVVSLRRGVSELLGLGIMLVDRRVPGMDCSLMHLMEEIVEEVHSSERREFQLSNAARVLQELYGPATDHDVNVQLQARIRAVCVVVTCLEAVGRDRYESQPFLPQEAPKRKVGRPKKAPAPATAPAVEPGG